MCTIVFVSMLVCFCRYLFVILTVNQTAALEMKMGFMYGVIT